MEQAKSWLLSKGVWGGVLAGVGSLLSLLGYDFGAPDQAAVADMVEKLVSMGGAALAIYGRVVASKALV